MRWMLTALTPLWAPNNYIVETSTDVENHLYLWWSPIPPNKPVSPHPRRGNYCIVGDWLWTLPFYSIDQTIPGNTLEHTHIWPSWEPGETRYYMFFPSLDLTELHSVSPVFTLTAPEEFPDMRHLDLTDKEIAGVIDHADGSITPAKIDYPFTFQQHIFSPASAPTQDYHLANKKYVDDAPGYNPWAWLMSENIHLLSDFTPFSQSISGSGATLRSPLRLVALTGVTAGSLAVAYREIWPVFHTHSQQNYFEADNPLQICFFGQFVGTGPAIATYAWMRCSQDLTGGDLAQKGWGWRYNREGPWVYAQSHDGVGLESTLTTPPPGLPFKIQRYLIIHDPPTEVRFYIDDTLVATHTVRVPSGWVPGHLSIGAENPGQTWNSQVFTNRIILRSDWR